MTLIICRNITYHLSRIILHKPQGGGRKNTIFKTGKTMTVNKKIDVVYNFLENMKYIEMGVPYDQGP